VLVKRADAHSMSGVRLSQQQRHLMFFHSYCFLMQEHQCWQQLRRGQHGQEKPLRIHVPLPLANKDD